MQRRCLVLLASYLVYFDLYGLNIRHFYFYVCRLRLINLNLYFLCRDGDFCNGLQVLHGLVVVDGHGDLLVSQCEAVQLGQRLDSIQGLRNDGQCLLVDSHAIDTGSSLDDFFIVCFECQRLWVDGDVLHLQYLRQHIRVISRKGDGALFIIWDVLKVCVVIAGGDLDVLVTHVFQRLLQFIGIRTIDAHGEGCLLTFWQLTSDKGYFPFRLVNL